MAYKGITSLIILLDDTVQIGRKQNSRHSVSIAGCCTFDQLSS